MSNSLFVFDEPMLEFRYKQQVADPRDGLGLFGPYDADSASRPLSLSYMTIGTPEGVSRFRVWSQLLGEPATFAPRGNSRLWPPYPGFEAAFTVKWPQKPVTEFSLDREELLAASQLADPYKRAQKVVEFYLDPIRRSRLRDERIGVAVCVVPDDVYTNCRPESVVSRGTGERISSKELTLRRQGQAGLFDDATTANTYQLSRDFRRQLKALSMAYDVPVQIIRESTLRPNDEKVFGQRGLTPLSDRMWNISTTLYYKCGGKPWRLMSAREGVCYIGIAFRKSDDGRTACCAAQMFLDTGDGVVFLGQFGPWYSEAQKQFHLSQTAAKHLLAGVLKTYADTGGKPLKEVFLHSRSEISNEEFEGYREACPEGVKLVGVRVRADRDDPRLYRQGSMPVLRGTFWRISDKAGYLWGSGFKPRIGTYDGWEIPQAMRIEIQQGDALIERVAQDIFGLTKLNYNACRLGESEPVTVGFSDAVGEILVSNPTVEERRPQFRYYI